jgi:RuvB-like protein 1
LFQTSKTRDSDFLFHALPIVFLEMVQISEVKGNIRYRICTDGLGTARENRVAAHSHIRGLGLREDGIADQSAAGFIGQQQAREVL